MSMHIPLPDLKTLAKNHSDTLTLSPLETRGAIISREKLEAFLAEAESLYQARFDAIRIYFVRHKLNIPNTAEAHIKKAQDPNLSQVSLILAPVNILDRGQWRIEDLTIDNTVNGEVMTLCICHPEEIVAENPPHTGHCPPKIGCQ